MSVLHKADQIKLFAVGKFCHHFVWKGYDIPESPQSYYSVKVTPIVFFF